MVLLATAGALSFFGPSTSRAQAPRGPELDTRPVLLWKAGVGKGFSPRAQEVGLSGGAGFGIQVMGSKESHDWGIGTLHYGHMLTDVIGEGHWYRGNFELLGELFGGQQFSPGAAYFIGLTPHVRYNFATGTRWVPFFDLGAGVTATDIRDGDLSTTFEFNLQGGGGTHFFLRDNLALTLQVRYIHISNARISTPDYGVNNITALFGVSRFF